ncbi:MAG TPA: glucose-6-phosphate dehydrogenase [Pseudonocardia sp.]
MNDLRPTIFVLFGATGDLARRMVLPAFAALAVNDLMPEKWVLVGNGRKQQDDAWFADHVRDVLDDETQFAAVRDHLLFAGNGFTADDAGDLPDTMARARQLTDDDALVVHYIALPPSTFEPYVQALDAHGLAKGSRVVFEKPYGTSSAAFEHLEGVVRGILDEEQIYRLDHFLGKEATQNLHVLRFANAIIGDAWCNTVVEQVQIDVPETLDIDDRAEFYDATGATLDMVVTHLLQVAAEIAMEPPASLAPGELLDARESVIANFRPIDPSEVVLGQYEGYRDVEHIAADSETDTFIAARMWVDTERWEGVPFLLRTGKRLAVSAQRVTLLLKPTGDGPVADPPSTAISLSLQGAGELDIEVVTKRPGLELALSTGTAALPLSHGEGTDLPAYATLIRDVLKGDRSLFTSSEGLAATWRTLTPLLEHRPKVLPYAQGSWGPEAADALPGPDGWHLQRTDRA